MVRLRNNDSFFFFYTSTLVVDTRFIGRTIVVTPTADVAHQPVANLSAPAIVIFAAQRFAHGNGNVTLFVRVTGRVGSAHWLTRVVFARVPGRTFSVFTTRFGRRSDTRYLSRGIRDESDAARAHGSLVGHRTYSVGATRHRQTRIRAHVVSA